MKTTLELACEHLNAVRDDLGPGSLGTLLAFRVPAGNPVAPVPGTGTGTLASPDGTVGMLGVLNGLLAKIAAVRGEPLDSYLASVEYDGRLVGFDIMPRKPAAVPSSASLTYGVLWAELRALTRNERGESEEAGRLRTRMDQLWKSMTEREREDVARTLES